MKSCPRPDAWARYAEKHKVEDIGRHHAHGDAVDALRSQVKMFYDPDDVISPVTQHTGQPGSQQAVNQGQGADDGQRLTHDPAAGLGDHDDGQQPHDVLLNLGETDVLDENLFEENDQVQGYAGSGDGQGPVRKGEPVPFAFEKVRGQGGDGKKQHHEEQGRRAPHRQVPLKAVNELPGQK